MVTQREPILHPVAILDLHPTQITVGLREVAAKRKAWRSRLNGGSAASPGGREAKRKAAGKKVKEKARQKAAEYLGKHMIPAILGPKERPYIIDHHHLARALHDEGVKNVLITIVADLRRLDLEAFWFMLDCHNWMHPFDDRGRRRGYEEIPGTVEGLVDDPFRSLAGELRHLGGFAKDTTPFSEFLWADFLRRRMKRKSVEADFAAALEAALELAKSHAADYLPGWCGATARPDAP
jgi:hypothetical protein